MSKIGYKTFFKQKEFQQQSFIQRCNSSRRTSKLAQKNIMKIKNQLLSQQSTNPLNNIDTATIIRKKILSRSSQAKQFQLKKVCTVQKPVITSKYKNRLARLPQSNSTLSTNVISTEYNSKNATLNITQNKYEFESASFKKSVRQLVVHKLRDEMPKQIQRESPLKKSRIEQKCNSFKRAFTPNTLVKRAKQAFHQKQGSFLPGLTSLSNANSRKGLLLNKREQSRKNLYKQL